MEESQTRFVRRQPFSVGGGVTITDVTTVDGTTALVTFSGPVTIAAGATVDTHFGIAGSFPFAAAVDSPVSAAVTFSDSFGAGDPWSLTGQPSWLVTPVTSPASGVVS